MEPSSGASQPSRNRAKSVVFLTSLTTPCQGKCWRTSRLPRTRTAPDLLPTRCERAALDSEPLPLEGIPEREAGEISDAHVPERDAGGEEDDIAVAPLGPFPWAPAASSNPPKRRITPKSDRGNSLKSVATESERNSPMNRIRAPRITSAPPVRAPNRTWPAIPPAPWHIGTPPRLVPTRFMIPWSTATAFTRDAPVRKERVVLLHGGDDGVAQRQRHLGKAQNHDADREILPADLRQGQLGQADVKRHPAQLAEKTRLARTSPRSRRGRAGPASPGRDRRRAGQRSARPRLRRGVGRQPSS